MLLQDDKVMNPLWIWQLRIPIAWWELFSGDGGGAGQKGGATKKC